jgi:DNA-binding response OmpR family regulator
MTTILIIDDEQPTLQMLALYLEASGHTVMTAEDEAGGLAVFQREKPARRAHGRQNAGQGRF